MSDIGHNDGPEIDGPQDWVDYRHALQVAIRDCKTLPARARVLGIIVCTYMDYEGKGAHPSYRLLSDITGFGVNQIKELIALVEAVGLMQINRGVRGSKTSYQTAQAYEDAIATYIRGNRGKNAKVSPSGSDTSGKVTPLESDTVEKCHPVSEKVSLSEAKVSPKTSKVSLPESDRRIEDNKNKNIPPNPQRGNGDDLSNAFVDPYFAEGVLMGPDGCIQLVNGTRSYWLKLFNDDEIALDLAVKEAAAEIQPNSKKPLKPQIERILARTARQRRDQDRRYAEAVERKSGRTTKSDVSERKAMWDEIFDSIK